MISFFKGTVIWAIAFSIIILGALKSSGFDLDFFNLVAFTWSVICLIRGLQLANGHSQLEKDLEYNVCELAKARRLNKSLLGDLNKLRLHTRPDWAQALGLYSKEAIESAFKRLMKNAHPDKGGSDERARELIEARNKALKSKEN